MSEANGVTAKPKAYRPLQLDRDAADAMKVLATEYVLKGRDSAVVLAEAQGNDKDNALREYFFHVKRVAEDHLK